MGFSVLGPNCLDFSVARVVSHLWLVVRGVVVAGPIQAVRVLREHGLSMQGLRRWLIWLDERLAERQQLDPRVYAKWVERQPGMATGDPLLSCPRIVLESKPPELHESTQPYVCLMVEEATLSDESLHRMLVCAGGQAADVVYADEDVLCDGRRVQPRVKPQFSPRLLQELDYIGPVIVARQSTLKRYLNIHKGVFETLEFVRWVDDEGGHITHSPGAWVHWHAARKPIRRKPARVPFNPTVSIIIPTRDRLPVLRACIESIYDKTEGEVHEVLVLDNGSEESATLRWMDEAPSRFNSLRVVRCERDYNWSALNNIGLLQASGEICVFLNNDTQITDGGWLLALVQELANPRVATVGGLLFFPDGAIQHAGIVVGIGAWADHVYRGSRVQIDDDTLFINPYLSRNVLGSTGACLAVRRSTFESVGKFDERLVHTGDLEFCLRAHAVGMWNVLCAQAQLLHHEAMTRQSLALDPEEQQILGSVMETYLCRGDPFYNPHLDLRVNIPRLKPSP